MKRYFVWKDANCNGINPEWLEIGGKEFYELVNKPENAKRKFIPWYDEDGEIKDTFLYEATEEAYRDWDKQRKHEARLKKHYYDERMLFVDWDEVVYYDDVDPITRADMIPDPDAHVGPTDDELFVSDLYKALETLNEEERKLVDLLFLNNDGRSEVKIARELGIPQQTLNYRKNVILKKLRAWFGRN